MIIVLPKTSKEHYLTGKRYGYEPNDAVYSANHYRAIADMVYDDLHLDQNFEGAIILDDWLPSHEYKQKFFSLFEKAKDYLTLEQWNRYIAWKHVNSILKS